MLDTYAKKSESKDTIREVWNNLDGTRGLQLTKSASLPGGFQDRVFKNWFTWVKRVEADGLQTFIIAFCPLKKYKGTHHKADGEERMQEGTSRGVYIVKELTEHTCTCTKVQQADLKVGEGKY